jgi:hypothetical protein
MGLALKTPTAPPEAAIKANEREAARMFERGVAAAKGGQRRVAAVLLARAVQLDPQHELGWLWLSGVIEKPEEIAFCLRSALALNPANERARKGLAWLEERRMIAQLNGDAPAPPPALRATNGANHVSAAPPPAPIPEAPAEPSRRRWLPALPALRLPAEDDHSAVYHGESWWVNWRRSRRAMGRARLVLLSVPLLLLALTLALNLVLRGALERNTALAEAAAARSIPTAEVALPAPRPAQVLQRELRPMADARVLAYLSAIDAPRARLRDAVQSYRNATSQPGGSSTAHAAAARRLREHVDEVHQTLERITPPPSLGLAHAEYLAGLEHERSALDEMLNFYGSFRVELANRAALEMESAGASLERARAAFDRERSLVDRPVIHAQSVR